MKAMRGHALLFSSALVGISSSAVRKSVAAGARSAGQAGLKEVLGQAIRAFNVVSEAKEKLSSVIGNFAVQFPVLAKLRRVAEASSEHGSGAFVERALQCTKKVTSLSMMTIGGVVSCIVDAAKASFPKMRNGG
jgi:hypothetical protein